MKPSTITLMMVLVILLGIMPASAITIGGQEVSQYSFTADTGKVIYQITIDDLPIGSNQTHTLVYAGQPYLLSVNTWAGTGWETGRRFAEVTLTYPNGTQNQKTVSALGPLAGNYRTSIQPVFVQSYSQQVPVLECGLSIGVLPTTAEFVWVPQTWPAGWEGSNALPFKSASGTWTGATSTKVWVEEITEEEFQKNVVNYNPVYGISNLGSQVFQWSWSMVLGFLNMIPVVGPIAVSFITMLGGLLEELWFWLEFVALNLPAIILALESLILMMAVINAGKGKRAFGRLAGNFYHYNLAVVLGMISLFTIVRDLIGWTVDLVTKVIEALKPI